MMEWDFYVLTREFLLLFHIAFYGVIAACFSFFLHYCIGIENFECVEGKAFGVENNIFAPYGNWVACMYCKYKKNAPWIAWLMKPLGVCIYCFNAWVTIFAWIAIGYEANALLPMLGISFVVICHLKARY